VAGSSRNPTIVSTDRANSEVIAARTATFPDSAASASWARARATQPSVLAQARKVFSAIPVRSLVAAKERRPGTNHTR
jgi:hypothetical protein